MCITLEYEYVFKYSDMKWYKVNLYLSYFSSMIPSLFLDVACLPESAKGDGLGFMVLPNLNVSSAPIQKYNFMRITSEKLVKIVSNFFVMFFGIVINYERIWNFAIIFLRPSQVIKTVLGLGQTLNFSCAEPNI